MTDQERRLAEALRDLCGWHVGMVTDSGRVVVRLFSEMHLRHLMNLSGDGPMPFLCLRDSALPDLDSPANWGHWLAWCWRNTSGDLRLESVACGRWHILWRGENERSWVATAGWPSPACAILELVARVHEDTGLPPSVLAWWEHEQGEASDGRK